MKIENDFKLNVVPLIDVMLVLLTIVLCAASFIEYSKVDMNLPKSGTSSDEFPKQRVEISLYADGTMKFDGNLVDIETLELNLGALDKKTPLIFKGDEKSEFKYFIDIVQLLKKHELSNFIIMTEVKK
ncbi:biopolymer transporter ExbD [Campylobacter sp. RM12327]|uniref:Biopolymer transport protein ExbD/TolR n=1 Tax=Campylobacter sputorum subsp. sputorum TaxID=32024 RepID=A0A381DJN8_9BACT|nr:MULTISPECIES: biopolymer transporter ExbD [Campylobacter]ASM35919.1 TonB system transport protein ExbD [Campylobacter sputorum aubsp. sputorum RM3237]ASM37603.1 TonB system transport protein ExbD [Campylobacter sputorum bv. faecalis CCUG 20703]ASM39267.1 TonB system transport protein ExbD [Campylobacter sputorum bv. paraureolyticus LMG 11764]ASM40850.1 TonB system transport protein ExbD [Campylobacter sputorum]KAB0582346.1 biopolymer transporter ExbD [Campylobacter sputorum subsp. sputorum]